MFMLCIGDQLQFCESISYSTVEHIYHSCMLKTKQTSVLNYFENEVYVSFCKIALMQHYAAYYRVFQLF